MPTHGFFITGTDTGVGKTLIDALILLPVAAPKDRMRQPQLDEAAGEVVQRHVATAPVEPRDLVVLTPGIVVAVLRSPPLVATEHHRDTLREQQRREEVPLLPRAQRENRTVLRRAFDAAVP